ncbi:MAG: DNA topoisomerase, partial [Firmicutes bacterium]|nr:DNA topoisomerase [Bacillota bacterium]
MAEKKKTYDQESIKALKGADRVRLRPAVIFGSDGIEGCEHAVFEIISNSIDEAREGYGSKIIVSKNLDGSFSVEDFGRGIPVEFNNAENEYNWRLVFCELYAGGKYNQTEGENYNFALGLNGLGTCATQYASRWMKARIRRDGFEYELSFERGNNTAKDPGFTKTEANKKSGTLITWLPDLDVFTDIDVSMDYLRETLKKQAIVNAGVTFILKEEMTKGKYVEESFCYPEGIRGYVAEEAKNPISSVQYFAKDTSGRDRPDKPEYKLKMSMAFCFTENGGDQEYYHNSSYLEHGGSPLKAVKAAFVYALDKYIKEQGKYLKNESVPSYDDIFDSLFFVSSCFSTSVSYENQTKKAITNKFVEKAMTEFLKEVLARYFAENKVDADRIMNQVLINKRSREEAEKSRVSIKKKLSGTMNVTNKVAKF